MALFDGAFDGSVLRNPYRVVGFYAIRPSVGRGGGVLGFQIDDARHDQHWAEISNPLRGYRFIQRSCDARLRACFGLG